MNVIGNIAAFFFVLLGVLMLAPIFFTSSVRESYGKSDFWSFVEDLPNWFSYLVLIVFSVAFWAIIGYFLFR